ncbi:MAG: hypothetical protein KJ970_08215 [Candidatus Eisenbacteria bacterium]|uniref:Transglutaminase-like domain-containing protein n=1 Tax=Eiseniibacteriota bacterium TaxID=2212470 RepID=A0A948RWL9_UNCEI|nr:hypothetical protein [Candidatus Eisenbacteria bacterium]
MAVLITALTGFASSSSGQSTNPLDDSGLYLRSIPSPIPHPADLAWDGEALWVADWESGNLIRINPENGDIITIIPAPCYRPRGLTWAEQKLYIVDDVEGMIHIFDPASGITVGSYMTPSGTGLGLAWDGEALWLSDNGAQQLQCLIPHDGTTLTAFPSPEQEPGGLAYIDGYLWVAQRNHDRIYMVEPKSGAAITRFNSPGPYPSGIAPAPDGRLWIADFEDGLIWLCAPREARPYQTSDWRDAEIRLTYRLENLGPGMVQDAVVHFAFPEPELENQLLLSDPVFTTPSPEIHFDQWGEKMATFRSDRIPPGERFEAGYTAQARIANLNYIIIPEKVGPLSDIPREIREAYTADGERLQVQSELVQKTAAGIVGDESNPYWIARRIFNWVIDTLEYERVGGWDVPETLIKRGTGSCSEYTFLYIALCRAAGLPARYEAGASLRGDDVSVDDVHHRWAEVYLPNYGWIPIDPSGGDQATPGGQVDAIGRLSNRYFITTHNGGGSDILSWNYNFHAVHSRKGRCAVTEDEWVVWRRAKEEGESILPGGAYCKP